MKVAVAGIPGAWSSERMAQSLRAAGITSCVFSPDDVLHDLSSGAVELHGDDLRSFDGVVVKKLGSQADPSLRLRLHAFRALEAAGVRVFSPPDVIDVVMDRYRMTMALAAADLPIPRTLAISSPDLLSKAVEALGEAVVKPVYTSKGRGMFRARAGETMRETPPDGAIVVQEYVRAPGRDIGATVIAGRFVGAFYRVAAEDNWMTTTERGGRYAPCDLSAAGIALAERAARLFGLDYTVVDMVECGEDRYLLYEASAFGGFRGLLEASGIDASAQYAEHVRATLETR
jgi:ribosomal protein S6--L-glutamate ligase